MTHSILWHPAARDDLLELYDWIDERADMDVAHGYVLQVEAFANGLADFPGRGTPRDHLVPGMRTMTFRRRTIVAYRVDGEVVHILRIVRAARDIAALLGTE
ncbi:type II toxin-antitoxin system RelE/ParE family toxin [Sphingomonas colocasiae]|uniref:Type II toxin-antitoxin system RelE/ParE family toxin n=1 Tax=Sphingomonas colocasiae TaxID=1848973 RepID=A0ABS7PWF4_9SPHN|nr:type II toxin-antitoxin system RelE/ParE family toxin [Sphingomonas colocasiae]